MQTKKKPDIQSHFRELQCGAPIFMIELNEYITLTFDYNFGAGKKDLLFGLIFRYYSGNGLTES